MDESQVSQSALAQGSTFVWHELDTHDQNGAIAFYTEALDFGVSEMDMGEMGVYKMLTRNGRPVCGVTTTDAVASKQVHSNWATYLAVDDTDARVEKCVSMGAKVEIPPHDIPTVGRMALIVDPQGAYIWLFQPSSD